MAYRKFLSLLPCIILFAIPIDGIAGQLVPVEFGLAEGNGISGCVSFKSPDVREGELITLVTVTGFTQQQRVLRGTVGARLSSPSSCRGLEDPHFNGTLYSLSLSLGSFEVENLAIAVRNSTSFKTLPEGESAGLASSGSHTLYFRSCATREGLYLTAWAGKPLKGKRLWSEYYYLGYDVDPDCTELDFKRMSRIIKNSK